MSLTEEAKQARREYKRAWNKANPDKVKAAQERYWQRVADARRSAHIDAEAEAANNDRQYNTPNVPGVLSDTGR